MFKHDECIQPQNMVSSKCVIIFYLFLHFRSIYLSLALIFSRKFKTLIITYRRQGLLVEYIFVSITPKIIESKLTTITLLLHFYHFLIEFLIELKTSKNQDNRIKSIM